MLLVERIFEPKKRRERKYREGEGEEKVCRGVEFEHFWVFLTPLLKL